MSTAIIPRDPSTPSPRVLEIDGPRRKYVQRGQGRYYLSTSNTPACDELYLRAYTDGQNPSDPRLVDWDQPHWKLYQNHDGSHEFHACRPTDIEINDGDIHGHFGSVINFSPPTREAYLYAFRLTRKLTKCDSQRGLRISPYCPRGTNITIETRIPIALDRTLPTS